jgi:hypothetical protein
VREYRYELSFSDGPGPIFECVSRNEGWDWKLIYKSTEVFYGWTRGSRRQAIYDAMAIVDRFQITGSWTTEALS